MKSEREIQKMLTGHTMRARQCVKNKQDDLWRIQIAKISILENILGCKYDDMVKIRKKQIHDEKKRRMEKAWEKNLK